MAKSGTGLKVITGGNEPSIGSEKWSAKVRKHAKGLAGQLDTGYMELAQLLHTIQNVPATGEHGEHVPIFVKWGYSSFNEYVEGELGIHRKKAQRLKRIWFKLEVQLKDKLDEGTKARLIALGFSKMRVLIRVITPRNSDKWIEKAEELSYPKLCLSIQKYEEDVEKAEARRREVAAGDPSEDGAGGEDVATIGTGTSGGIPLGEPPVPEYSDDDLKPINFMAYPEQRDMINAALERAEQLSGSSKKTQNLHLICMDFLASNEFSKATRKQRLQWVAKMEGLVGFKLVAVDGPDVVYGIKTLQQLADVVEEE